MKQKDASFTFLDRVREIELNIEDHRWQSALALALTLPDICGGIAYPEMVKKFRDGRVMFDRQKNPARDVGSQYIKWFDDFAAVYFKLSPKDEKPYICGERCWQLRCEYLHQNKGFSNEDEMSDIHFHLGVNCGTSLCESKNGRPVNESMNIRIDIEQFCLRMCQAATAFYNQNHKQKDFDLYNTPVLDFINRSAKNGSSDKMIVLICQDPSYGQAIQKSLCPVTKTCLVFHTVDITRKELKHRKPDLWIVEDRFAEETKRPWCSNSATPVLFLARSSDVKMEIQKESNKVDFLYFPIRPEELRNKAKQLMDNGGAL